MSAVCAACVELCNGITRYCSVKRVYFVIHRSRQFLFIISYLLHLFERVWLLFRNP